MDDVFEDWQEDEFFLAADRLFRYNETYRLDPEGRGLFFGRPRLDIVVVGGAHENGP